MLTTQTAPGTSLSQLPERILRALEVSPSQKADELAHLLKADATEVLKCLTSLQGSIVHQDATYRWSLREDADVPGEGGSAGYAKTEISRLNQYFLDCLGQDSDTGVSVFAKGAQGAPDYAEMARHPHATAPEGTEPWWAAAAVRRVLASVRGDKRNMEAWVGYPVRLRKHKTATWEGFFVEPLLLWRITFPANVGEDFTLDEGLPQVNFSFLRNVALGGASDVVEEAAALGTELGLNNRPKDQPSTAELLLRLFSLRPDWDWVEPLEPLVCSSGTPLAALREPGIYNRAIVVPSQRSPYTQGLESELKALAHTHPVDFLGTALDQWFQGQLVPDRVPDDDLAPNPLIEVLPMNSEQRAAVQSALTEPLTVVTGPPGTGKSQVVTNLLVNAAWRGMKVLFASKNNKAVDVVQARVNNLGARPVLLRLGSSEYQNKLASYFSSVLSGHVGPEDLSSYKERLERHNELIRHAELLDQLQLKTIEARNYVDRLDSDVEGYRALFGQAQFSGVTEELLEVGRERLAQFLVALEALNPQHAGLFDRLFAFFLRDSRIATLMQELDLLAPVAQELGADELDDLQEVGFQDLQNLAASVSEKLDAGGTILTYKAALEALLMSPPLEAIAYRRLDISAQVARNSTGLWRDWVQLAPSRLSAAERKDVAEYASLLQVLNDPTAKNLSPTIRQRAFTLQQKVTALFSCWAVTSLSVRGRVPLEPGYFDLVVIDEAGQCDIASAIPLLFRAKRAVIIGDPMQLKHISALSRAKDMEFQEQRGLAQTRAAWLYSVNSLYDLAAGVSAPGSIINLRDHHRSHSDIIEFSNKFFYGGRLRVATRQSALTRPDDSAPGVGWTDVRGECVRPTEGGLRNPQEAQEVVRVLKQLLLDRKFKGTVGVVTPFRAQVNLIQQLLQGHQDLAEAAARCELLVDTVHKFQGDERDVIVFSPVLSANVPSSAVAFLRNNANLFNVAITRARALLHVVGDAAATQACDVEYLSKFSQYALTLKTPLAASQALQADLGSAYPEVPAPEQVSEWERVLYRALYAAGVHATPQLAVEQYTLDFALQVGRRKLNIEVDGDWYHRSWTKELCLRDQLRSQRLLELGWEVKRLWVYELRDRLPECVEQILEWVNAPR